MKKPRITDQRIREILHALGEEKTYDDIEALCKRSTISAVKKWYNSVSWRAAAVYAEGDETILKVRTDYLEKKAEDIPEIDNRLKRHFAELSETALTLASNLEDYLKYFGNDFGDPVGDVIYGGPLPDDFHDALTPEMREVNRPLTMNLLYHLKEEFPELVNISDWAQLTSNKITHNFIVRLKLKANRGDFVGNCHLCPSD